MGDCASQLEKGRSDYTFPAGGYLDNGSTGYTPRFGEEVVRQLFISSAAFLIEEMHVDGLRVDLTQAIHRDNVRHRNDNRIIVFKRWSGDEEVIIATSLNNTSFANGYEIKKDLLAISNAGWKEIFNSDAAIYGGGNAGNGGATVSASQGCLNIVIPASGFVVFVKQ